MPQKDMNMTHSEQADFLNRLEEAREAALHLALFLELPPEKVENFVMLAVESERDRLLS